MSEIKHRAKRQRLKIACGLCVTLIAVAGLRFWAVAEPQSMPSYALFRCGYFLSADKGRMLQSYSSTLGRYNGHSIPEQVDSFLCNRLQSSSSAQELAAIADFYASHAGGREGRLIFRLPPAEKEKVIALLMRKLDDYAPYEAGRALILVEVMRRGKDLGKANFGPTLGQPPDYEVWWRDTGLPEATARFKTWWNVYPTWRQREQHDPLQGSTVQIYSP